MENEKYMWPLIARVLGKEATQQEKTLLQEWIQQSSTNRECWEDAQKAWQDDSLPTFDSHRAFKKILPFLN